MSIDKLIKLATDTTVLAGDKAEIAEVQSFISELSISPSPIAIPYYLVFWTYLKWRQSKRPDYISYKDLSKYFPEAWKKSRDSDGVIWYVSSEAFDIEEEEKRHAYIYLIRDKIAQKRRNTWLKRKRNKRRKNVVQKNTQD